MMAHGADNFFTLHYFDGVDYLPRILITTEGNVGIGNWDPATEVLDVNGNARFRGVGSAAPANDLRITADGTLTTNASDVRMKEDFIAMDNSLERVLRMNGYTFNWIPEEGGTRDVGMIAQEVEKVYP